MKSKNIAVIRLVNALGKVERKEPVTRKEKRGVKRLLSALALSITLTSCGFNANFCQGAGCKADADLAVGIIAETKNPKDKKSSYWQNREIESNQKTWIENLFSGKRLMNEGQ